MTGRPSRPPRSIFGPGLIRHAGILLAVTLSVVFSIRFLDEGLARWVMALHRSNRLLAVGGADIPDLLLPLVVIGTAAMWWGYFRVSAKGGDETRRRFLRLAATTVPVAFFLKALLQGGCGRIQTRLWLAGSGSAGFSWLSGTGGFPSGHMLVFTAFSASVWRSFPRYRFLALSLPLLLAMALVATDYHFLSDVIAGAYLGTMVTTGIDRLLTRFGEEISS